MFDERDDLIEAIARELRCVPPTDAMAVKSRIMAAVQGESPRWRLVRAWRWLRAPRTVRVTPLGGLAVAAGVAGIVAALWLRDPPTSAYVAADTAAPTERAGPASESVTATGASSRQMVQFVLVAPSASRVSLVGDFNGWDARATPLRQASRRGVWAVEVPLTLGRHAYAFVVDDSTWMADPVAARAPGDDFGTPSSVIVVGGGAT